MTVAGEDLVVEALAALGCVDRGVIGAAGGQKAVRFVERNNQPFVLKVVAVDFASPETLKRAEREVSLLLDLHVENVVQVASPLVELGSPVRGAAWLEEYLDGEDLTAYLGTPWPWEQAKDMARQVALGVAAGHAKGVIHRDLSSNNVRRLSNGAYKVLDFGFAKHTLRSGLTVAGQPGTYNFLTPEHLNSYSGGPMPASDVFQIGALLYFALSGRLPFPYAGDEPEYFNRLHNGEYPDIGDLREDLSADAIALIRRTLHKQPARRYLNGERLAAALDDIS
ncbi:serine/threonine-protein kinase [Cryobacterium sp. PH31-L1]|uniref:serine/threonine protein kinase n=1 Tax=Cryobacterium sp. PH31-L1 TaxID=3046199 RepID=UPI0024B9911B|nr:serine/threonine-protein kinase [Cryobacterium sp. PH31-L1]MDJ0378918.1 serine/threonine-protein kinase [Cryobacterium sp. PH31-L1]